MKALNIALKSTPVVYVTRDLERALGLPSSYDNYYIIANFSPYAKEYTKGRKNILLIKEKELLDTRELLDHPRVVKYIKKIIDPQIVVFKNTLHIEKLCESRGWSLLNPPSYLANRIEEKISQITWLGPLKKYLPPHQVMLCKDLQSIYTESNPAPEEFIVQFNRAHTGGGTILVTDKEQVQELREKFPNREVRVTKFIAGASYTLNVVVWNKKVLLGNISYQITGLPPFTDSAFATIGNDWALPQKLLTKKQLGQIQNIGIDIGKKLAAEHWWGLFGIDVIVEEKSGTVYLIEINARQPASTTFESQLQQSVILTRHGEEESKSQPLRSFSAAADQDDNTITIFETHLNALLGLPPSANNLQVIKNGAQIIDRCKESKITKKELQLKINKLNHLGLNTWLYSNTNLGADHLRVQSKQGIMLDHNKFNSLGNKICAILTPQKPAQTE